MLQEFNESVAFIQSRINTKPSVGIILGTGLGGLVNEIEIECGGDIGTVRYRVSALIGAGG